MLLNHCRGGMYFFSSPRGVNWRWTPTWHTEFQTECLRFLARGYFVFMFLFWFCFLFFSFNQATSGDAWWPLGRFLMPIRHHGIVNLVSKWVLVLSGCMRRPEHPHRTPWTFWDFLKPDSAGTNLLCSSQWQCELWVSAIPRIHTWTLKLRCQTSRWRHTSVLLLFRHG